MTHPWCSDVSRDEAIRAAEDAVERPALPDWRELPERVAALEREVAAILARVADLEAAAKLAPDANVGAESNQPPPRGWLTEEEREAVRLSALINLRLHDGKTAAALKAILARDSPPKVRLPECPIIRDGNASQCRGSGLDMAVDAVRAALAAAGVEVEE